MAPSDVEMSLEYILLVLSHTDFKPNYHAVAEAANITSANNAYATTIYTL